VCRFIQASLLALSLLVHGATGYAQGLLTLGTGSVVGPPASIPVAVDAIGTAVGVSGIGTSVTFNNITVGTGPNRALVVPLSFSSNASGTPVNGISCVWDSGGTNQSMTQVANATATNIISGSEFFLSAIFGLVAPTSGNKTLTCSWTNPAIVYVDAISFNNVLQTGGAITFRKGTTDTGSSLGFSFSVPSSSGDFVVAASSHALDNVITSPTTLYVGDTGAFGNAAAVFTPGAPSVGVSFSGTSTSLGSGWAASGVDVASVSNPLPNLIGADGDLLKGADGDFLLGAM